jgi:hypothetical protein
MAQENFGGITPSQFESRMNGLLLILPSQAARVVATALYDLCLLYGRWAGFSEADLVYAVCRHGGCERCRCLVAFGSDSLVDYGLCKMVEVQTGSPMYHLPIYYPTSALLRYDPI